MHITNTGSGTQYLQYTIHINMNIFLTENCCKAPKTKNKKPRSFTINSEFVPILETYHALRPKNAPKDNFSLNWQKGRCTIQVIGLNKIGNMPTRIATFLNLSEPGAYTGDSFHRTLVTLFTDSGANILELQRHCVWQTSAVVQDYFDESVGYKKKTAHTISNFINFSAKDNELEQLTNLIQKKCSKTTQKFKLQPIHLKK